MHISSILTHPVAESLASCGFAVIPSFVAELPSLEAFQRLGDVDVVEGLNQIHTLIPRAADEAAPNTYSGNFGQSDFPLHTDLAHWARPPRYLALRCVRGSHTVVTRIFDGEALIAHLGTESLRRALVQPRRPMRNGKQLLHLLERIDDPPRHMIRWDSIYLRPATSLSTHVYEEALHFLSNVTPAEVILLEPGDTLLVDNWRCLHGRSAAVEAADMRHIDRAYLKALYNGDEQGSSF